MRDPRFDPPRDQWEGGNATHLRWFRVYTSWTDVTPAGNLTPTDQYCYAQHCVFVASRPEWVPIPSLFQQIWDPKKSGKPAIGTLIRAAFNPANNRYESLGNPTLAEQGKFAGVAGTTGAYLAAIADAERDLDFAHTPVDSSYGNSGSDLAVAPFSLNADNIHIDVASACKALLTVSFSSIITLGGADATINGFRAACTVKPYVKPFGGADTLVASVPVIAVGHYRRNTTAAGDNIYPPSILGSGASILTFAAKDKFKLTFTRPLSVLGGATDGMNHYAQAIVTLSQIP